MPDLIEHRRKWNEPHEFVGDPMGLVGKCERCGRAVGHLIHMPDDYPDRNDEVDQEADGA